MKKMPGDIIILCRCAINDKHIMYGSWATECDRWNLLSFWTIFCTFIPLTTQKNKILKKWKKAWRYYHFTQVYNKWQSYDVWFLRYEAWQTEFFVILDQFLPSYPPKNQYLEKIKKTTGDIINLHKCTENHNHMLYCSWDMVRNRCNSCFSFWAIFCPFNPLTAQKSKILKKWKKAWRYHHFTYMYQKLWSDDVQFLRYGAWRTEKVTYRGGCCT